MDGEVLVLGRQALQSLLDMSDAIASVGETFAQHGRGECVQPPKSTLLVGDGGGFLNAMPAFVPAAGAAGIKWVASFPENARQGLPAVSGTVLLNDARTGRLQAIVDGGWLTTLRTGAATGVAARHLGAPKAPRLAFIGAGAQALSSLEAMLLTLEKIGSVRVSDPREEACIAFAKRAHTLCGALPQTAASAEEAVGDADIVVVATTSRTPVLARAWLRREARVIKIGSHHELADDLSLEAQALVVDDWEQHTHRGEFAHLIAGGRMDRSRLYAEVGELVVGEKRPPSPQGLAVACLMGMGSQDVALAAAAAKKARSRGAGAWVSLA